MERWAIWLRTARLLRDCATTAKSLDTSQRSVLSPEQVRPSSATSAKVTDMSRVIAPTPPTPVATTVESPVIWLVSALSPGLQVETEDLLITEALREDLVVAVAPLATSAVDPTTLPRTARLLE